MSGTKTKELLQQVGHEIKQNPPAILAQTAKKRGTKAANAQRIAIMLAKARKMGGRV